MIWRLLAIYAVVEIAALIALASAIGWGWTLFALLAAFALGWGILAPMAGSHLIHRIERLRTGTQPPYGSTLNPACRAMRTRLENPNLA